MHATRSSDHAHRRWRFAIFEVDLDSGELTRRGVRVPLPEKPFQVLQALIERPGELVTRKQLCERLWSADTFVDFDNNLNAAVRRLREALGDSANRPRFVETLPKRGYRLLAPVEAIEPAPRRRISPDEAPRADVADVADGHPTGLLGRRPILGLVVTLTLVVLVLVLRAAMAGKPAPGGEGPTPTGATPQRLMLAVLPFTDLDRRPDRAFFRDGLTEELITQLGRLQPERLGVIARMSSMHYRDSTRGVDQIGAELGVGYLLEGSLRSTDTRTRITVQLVQVADRTQIWGETYDVTLDDLLRVQGDVAVAVAQALALELLPEQPLAQARAGTRDTAAYEAYLRGRYAWHTFTSEGYDQAIAAFGRAVEIDPRYAAAWAGLAQAHNLDAFTSKSSPGTSFPAARHAAQTALALAPDLAAAHNALAFVQLLSLIHI